MHAGYHLHSGSTADDDVVVVVVVQMALRHVIGCLGPDHFVTRCGNLLGAADAVGWDSVLVHLPWVENHLRRGSRAILDFDPDLDLEQSDHDNYHLRHCGSSHAPCLGPGPGPVLAHGRDLVEYLE